MTVVPALRDAIRAGLVGPTLECHGATAHVGGVLGFVDWRIAKSSLRFAYTLIAVVVIISVSPFPQAADSNGSTAPGWIWDSASPFTVELDRLDR